MIETIEFNGKSYPALQAKGFASRYAFEFAQTICVGTGVDIGYSNPDWKLFGAKGIDLGKVHYGEDDGERIYEEVNALNFADNNLDYIFSSHCLEHLPDYVAALDYWHNKLKTGGNLFLYLPNMDYQEYWNPANNRKHVTYISPSVIQSYFTHRTDKWKNVTVTHGYDLNGSFYAIGEKI